MGTAEFYSRRRSTVDGAVLMRVMMPLTIILVVLLFPHPTHATIPVPPVCALMNGWSVNPFHRWNIFAGSLSGKFNMDGRLAVRGNLDLSDSTIHSLFPTLERTGVTNNAGVPSVVVGGTLQELHNTSILFGGIAIDTTVVTWIYSFNHIAGDFVVTKTGLTILESTITGDLATKDPSVAMATPVGGQQYTSDSLSLGVDLDDERDKVLSLSAHYAQLPQDYQSLEVTATATRVELKAGQNVLELSESRLASGTPLVVRGPFQSYLVVNVPGTVGLAVADFNMRVLWEDDAGAIIGLMTGRVLVNYRNADAKLKVNVPLAVSILTTCKDVEMYDYFAGSLMCPDASVKMMMAGSGVNFRQWVGELACYDCPHNPRVNEYEIGFDTYAKFYGGACQTVSGPVTSVLAFVPNATDEGQNSFTRKLDLSSIEIPPNSYIEWYTRVNAYTLFMEILPPLGDGLEWQIWVDGNRFLFRGFELITSTISFPPDYPNPNPTEQEWSVRLMNFRPVPWTPSQPAHLEIKFLCIFQHVILPDSNVLWQCYPSCSPGCPWDSLGFNPWAAWNLFTYADIGTSGVPFGGTIAGRVASAGSGWFKSFTLGGNVPAGTPSVNPVFSGTFGGGFSLIGGGVQRGGVEANLNVSVQSCTVAGDVISTTDSALIGVKNAACVVSGKVRAGSRVKIAQGSSSGKGGGVEAGLTLSVDVGRVGQFFKEQSTSFAALVGQSPGVVVLYSPDATTPADITINLPASSATDTFAVYHAAISAARLQSASRLRVNCGGATMPMPLPAGSSCVVVVNVGGATATLDGLDVFVNGFGSQHAAAGRGKVLLNYHQATSLNVAWGGGSFSLLAPEAAVVYNSGTFAGNWVVKSLTSPYTGGTQLNVAPWSPACESCL